MLWMAAGDATTIALLYFLLGTAFRLASVGCRHFCFSVGGAFIMAPFTVMTLAAAGLPPSASLAGGLATSVCIGALYFSLTAWLRRRSGQPVHLLIVSIATLEIVQHFVSLLFGNRSLRLAGPLSPEYAIAAGALVAIGTLVFWHRSAGGLLLRTLESSEELLEARGYSSHRIAFAAAMGGFAVAGLAGLVWSTTIRIKPTLALESAVTGVVAVLAGPLFGEGLLGVLAAACASAICRFSLAWLLQGDWALTSNLAILAVAYVLGEGRSALRRHADAHQLR